MPKLKPGVLDNYYKPMSFGFIILCPEKNPFAVKTTMRSINNYHDKSPRICVIPAETPKNQAKEIAEFCPNIVCGGTTITGLINLGLEKAETDWNFIIFAGGHFKPRFTLRYQLFTKNEKDILFPLINGQYNFVDGNMNGIFIHKNVLKDVGKFDEADDIKLVKTAWATAAIGKGYKFKSIIGARVL